MFTKFALALLLVLDCGVSLPGKICKIPNADAGTCILLNLCDPLHEISNNRSKTPGEDEYLRQSVGSCGSKGSQVKVCCPPKSQWSNLVVNPVIFRELNLPNITAPTKDATPTPANKSDENRAQDALPSPATVPKVDKSPQNTEEFQKLFAKWNKLQTYDCGLQYRSLMDRYMSRRVPDIDEYPWMALLEYGPNEFKCGGTLISKLHVLTAAHCLYISPTKVRLSEYNITSEPTDEGYVNSGDIGRITVTIMDVHSTIAHPDHVFMTSRNDIGIIRMKEKIRVNYLIRPICLPKKDYRNTTFTSGTKLFVSGWGSDSKFVNSEVKKSLLLPFVPIDICSETFAVQKDQHICAGGEEGVDSCRGDSGGPLMYEFDNAEFVIVGIVSSGASICGTKDHPGIYIYVYHYIDWIVRIMYNDEPTNT